MKLQQIKFDKNLIGKMYHKDIICSIDFKGSYVLVYMVNRILVINLGQVFINHMNFTKSIELTKIKYNDIKSSLIGIKLDNKTLCSNVCCPSAIRYDSK